MATTHIQGDFITNINGNGGRRCLHKWFCDGGRTRTYDLMVMSHPSCQLLHPANL